jgi:anti-sigma factor RsiW
MNHREAVEQMATERYLLEDFTPADREAFEEHLFDCPECAFDLRAGTAFVDEAKVQLPQTSERPLGTGAATTSKAKRGFWLFWMHPAFVAPAFAVLLGVVVFQNTVTFPALRETATQPHLVPFTHLRPATRGASQLTIELDRKHGMVVQVDVPAETAQASYAVDIRDAQGNLIWATTVPANRKEPGADQDLSLFVPATTLHNGRYRLDVAGLTAQGERTSVGDYAFDIVVTN